MKNIIKKWWFWVGLIAIVIICVIVYHYIEEKKLEKKFKSMGEKATEYYIETKKSKGYNDKFIYNYTTGEVDYYE